MSRYINAELAKEAIRKWFNTTTKAKAPMPRICKQAMTISIGAVDLTPTADVVEVRHGYWTGMNGDQCSNCGKSLRDLMDGDSYYSSEFEYGGFDALVACPFCGAKMDGERRTDDEG